MIEIAILKGLIQPVLGPNLVPIRQINPVTIRILLKNNTWVDVFQSIRDPQKFAIHAKCRDGRVFRLDCRPEKAYQSLPTYPWHFHEGKEIHVVASPFSMKLNAAIVEFIKFVIKQTQE